MLVKTAKRHTSFCCDKLLTFNLLFGAVKSTSYINHLVDRISSEMFLIDNALKHEMKPSREHNILRVSALNFLKPTGNLQCEESFVKTTNETTPHFTPIAYQSKNVVQFGLLTSGYFTEKYHFWPFLDFFRMCNLKISIE